MSTSARRRVVFGWLLCPLLLFGSTLHAELLAGSELQNLADAIGPAEARRAMTGIAARADATGPRGAFVSEIVSLADGTARFRLAMSSDDTDILLAAGTPYVHKDNRMQAADAAMTSFVRGHEVHRMLLDLEQRFRPDARAVEPGCLALRGPDALPVTICRAAGSERPSTIVLELPAALGGGTTTIELDDWRAVLGAQLPFAVDFLHAGERHAYRYTAVLAFRLAPGSALPPADAPEELFARLGDLADLASAHERTLQAHRQSDVRILLGDAAGQSTISGRGSLRESSRDELAARLGPYLESIRFTRYEDVVVPVVAVSADGSLGWLACQIEAAGESRVSKLADGSAEPIAYGFSWIELYASAAGSWKNIGNASSARP